MQPELITKQAPFLKSNNSIRSDMLHVIIALMPAVIASIYFFRHEAVILILSCVISAVIFDSGFQKLRGKKPTPSDISAVVTGLLFALVVPPGLPAWMAVLGVLAAVTLGKQIFGGLGANIFNPALVGRAFLTVTFPAFMVRWLRPISLDAVTTATPLGLMKFNQLGTSYQALFTGNVAGCLGETSALALLAGGIYLLAVRVIDWRIPAGYLGSVAVFSGILYFIDPSYYPAPLFHILAGGLLIGALFMATDPVTSPVSLKGKWVFAAGCGIMTMVLRTWGGLPEGVMYSILFMNALRPLIDKYFRPATFGAKT